MTDHPNAHLSDRTLNEYLDQALAEPERTAAAGHLAACARCTERLAALHVLFVGLAELPPALLGRDLRAGVLASIDASRPAAPQPRADPRRPAVQWVFAAQLLAGLVLLAFAWPFVAGAAHPEHWLGRLNAGPLAAGLAGAWLSFTGAWPTAEHWLAQTGRQPSLSLAALLPPVAAAAILAAAGALWLLGNALLLYPGPAGRPRRHS
jgi:hypothetical protein